jgi:protein-arginine kinase activator protein McsA
MKGELLMRIIGNVDNKVSSYTNCPEIINSMIEVDKIDEHREQELEKCKTCPSCGESRKFGMDSNLKCFGIYKYPETQVPIDIFGRVYRYITQYKCCNCGTLYESDPYRYY